MVGFEPLISNVRSDRSANCTTATALHSQLCGFLKQQYYVSLMAENCRKRQKPPKGPKNMRLNFGAKYLHERDERQLTRRTLVGGKRKYFSRNWCFRFYFWLLSKDRLAAFQRQRCSWVNQTIWFEGGAAAEWSKPHHFGEKLMKKNPKHARFASPS